MDISEPNDMKTPDPNDMDGMLKSLLTEEDRLELDAEDLAFINKMIRSLKRGSKGVFAVTHPGEQMQYVMIGTKRAGALAVMTKAMAHIAVQLEEQLG